MALDLSALQGRPDRVIPALIPKNKIAKHLTINLHDPSASLSKSIIKSLQTDGRRTVSTLSAEVSMAEKSESSSARGETPKEMSVEDKSEASSSSSSASIGMNITVKKQFAKGAYGSVCIATDEFQNEIAVKRIPTDRHGVPCLMEASIMSTIVHPNLTRVLRSHCTSKTFYLVSELAETDLSKYTRRDKGGHVASPEELKRWSASLLKALVCLHSQRIVHGDVKASNSLLFADGSVRLTDFTLAVKLWPGIEYRHTIATCTHRAPECWYNKSWREPSDIWSLGCTLYEVAYGQSLFPFQVDGMSGERETPALRDKSMACIYDWAQTPLAKRGFVADSVSFLKVEHPSRYFQPEYREFNEFVAAMLRIDPPERPTAAQLLQNPFLAGYNAPTSYEVRQKTGAKLSEREQDRARAALRHYTEHGTVVEHALFLYSRCLPIKQLSDSLKLSACLWIASKLILRTPIVSNDQPLHVMLDAERVVGHFLEFQLHGSA